MSHRASDQVYYGEDELKSMDKQKLVQVALSALRTVKHLNNEVDRLHNIMTMNGVTNVE